jgi:hypothetical protein
MSEKKNKKSNKNSSNKNKNFTSIQTLPESFFEEMINLEISLRKNFTLEIFQNLIEHYTKAIEFFSSTNDSRCERYKNNLKLLLNQKDVIKNINLNTKKGKIFVAKQNRKKIIEDCLNKIDLENNNNNNNINLLRESIQIREKKNVENNLNKSMETQIDKFKKRKEEKKKKWLLNKSNISNENVDVNNNNNNNNKKKVFSTKKNLNKSFDPIRNDENLFGNDEFEIEPMINVNNNIFDNNNNNFSLNDDKKNLTERLYEILDNFFKKFDEKFSQEFTINFINDLNELNKEKQKKLIENSQKISAKIKQIECELTQVENEEKKINLGKKIYEYENLKKKNDENINKEFKNKIVELKNNFKNNGINKLNLKEIKDNIVSSIENDVYNYMNS